MQPPLVTVPSSARSIPSLVESNFVLSSSMRLSNGVKVAQLFEDCLCLGKDGDVTFDLGLGPITSVVAFNDDDIGLIIEELFLAGHVPVRFAFSPRQRLLTPRCLRHVVRLICQAEEPIAVTLLSRWRGQPSGSISEVDATLASACIAELQVANEAAAGSAVVRRAAFDVLLPRAGGPLRSSETQQVSSAPWDGSLSGDATMLFGALPLYNLSLDLDEHVSLRYHDDRTAALIFQKVLVANAATPSVFFPPPSNAFTGVAVSLTRVSLAHNEAMTDAAANSLAECITVQRKSGCFRLDSLDVSHTAMTSVGVTSLARAIFSPLPASSPPKWGGATSSSVSCFHTLKVASIKLFDEAGTVALIDALRDGAVLVAQEARDFAEAKRAQSPEQPQGLAASISAMTAFNGLTCLDVSRNNLSETACFRFGRMYRTHPSLRILRLEHGNACPVAVAASIRSSDEALSMPSELVAAARAISNWYADGEGAKHGDAPAATLPSLLHFARIAPPKNGSAGATVSWGLQRDVVKDDAAVLLAESIAEADGPVDCITSVDLSFQPVTVAGFTRLLKALCAKASNLRTLRMAGQSWGPCRPEHFEQGGLTPWQTMADALPSAVCASTLEELDVSTNFCEQPRSRLVLQLISRLPNLRRFKLNGPPAERFVSVSRQRPPGGDENDTETADEVGRLQAMVDVLLRCRDPQLAHHLRALSEDLLMRARPPADPSRFSLHEGTNDSAVPLLQKETFAVAAALLQTSASAKAAGCDVLSSIVTLSLQFDCAKRVGWTSAATPCYGTEAFNGACEGVASGIAALATRLPRLEVVVVSLDTSAWCSERPSRHQAAAVAQLVEHVLKAVGDLVLLRPRIWHCYIHGVDSVLSLLEEVSLGCVPSRVRSQTPNPGQISTLDPAVVASALLIGSVCDEFSARLTDLLGEIQTSTSLNASGDEVRRMFSQISRTDASCEHSAESILSTPMVLSNPLLARILPRWTPLASSTLRTLDWSFQNFGDDGVERILNFLADTPTSVTKLLLRGCEGCFHTSAGFATGAALLRLLGNPAEGHGRHSPEPATPHMATRPPTANGGSHGGGEGPPRRTRLQSIDLTGNIMTPETATAVALVLREHNTTLRSFKAEVIEEEDRLPSPTPLDADLPLQRAPSPSTSSATLLMLRDGNLRKKLSTTKALSSMHPHTGALFAVEAQCALNGCPAAKRYVMEWVRQLRVETELTALEQHRTAVTKIGGAVPLPETTTPAIPFPFQLVIAESERAAFGDLAFAAVCDILAEFLPVPLLVTQPSAPGGPFGLMHASPPTSLTPISSDAIVKDATTTSGTLSSPSGASSPSESLSRHSSVYTENATRHVVAAPGVQPAPPRVVTDVFRVHGACLVTDRGARSLGKLLPMLRVVDLTGSAVTATTVSRLILWLPDAPKLQEITVSHCKNIAGLDAAENIVRLLKQRPVKSLRHIDVAGTRWAFETQQLVTEAVHVAGHQDLRGVLPKLKSSDLRVSRVELHDAVSDATLTSLADAMGASPFVTHISLSGRSAATSTTTIQADPSVVASTTWNLAVFRAFFSALASHGSIGSVAFDCCGITHSHLRVMLDVLERYCSSAASHAGSDGGDPNEQCPRCVLQELRITGDPAAVFAPLRDDDGSQLLPRIRACLRDAHCPLRVWEFPRDALSEADRTAIQTLSIRNSFNSRVKATIAAAEANLPSVRAVLWKDLGVDDEAVRQLCDAMSRAGHLPGPLPWDVPTHSAPPSYYGFAASHVDLSGNPSITDVGAIRLCRTLGDIFSRGRAVRPRQTFVSFDGCHRLTDVSAAAITAMLRGHPNVRVSFEGTFGGMTQTTVADIKRLSDYNTQPMRFRSMLIDFELAPPPGTIVFFPTDTSEMDRSFSGNGADSTPLRAKPPLSNRPSSGGLRSRSTYHHVAPLSPGVGPSSSAVPPRSLMINDVSCALFVDRLLNTRAGRQLHLTRIVLPGNEITAAGLSQLTDGLLGTPGEGGRRRRLRGRPRGTEFRWSTSEATVSTTTRWRRSRRSSVGLARRSSSSSSTTTTSRRWRWSPSSRPLRTPRGTTSCTWSPSRGKWTACRTPTPRWCPWPPGFTEKGRRRSRSGGGCSRPTRRSRPWTLVSSPFRPVVRKRCSG